MDSLKEQGWAMSTEPGTLIFVKSQAGEKIQIRVDAKNPDNKPPEDGEEAAEGYENQYDHFVVIVEKAKSKLRRLEFQCVADRGHLNVDVVRVLGPEGEIEAEVGLDELPDEGREAFFTYLEDRGISDSVCQIIFDGLSVYDDNEYVDWLKKVSEFVRI
eukprot:TRINITY_DN519_c0_g1_i2.p1 TRINITY_DN519_c0_g1~~TRINITY_DN519_c0_g1_i2.p1  ORF type:complete len:159 (-),score=44.10 TRINITY_DN519_c0_g1_i2:215-691(-)